MCLFIAFCWYLSVSHLEECRFVLCAECLFRFWFLVLLIWHIILELEIPKAGFLCKYSGGQKNRFRLSRSGFSCIIIAFTVSYWIILLSFAFILWAHDQFSLKSCSSASSYSILPSTCTTYWIWGKISGTHAFLYGHVCVWQTIESMRW